MVSYCCLYKNRSIYIQAKSKIMKVIRKISVTVIFIMISFCSCELLDKELNYISVKVDLWVYVTDKDGKKINGASVNMVMIKDGGEKIEGIGTTDDQGLTQAIGVFKLYREQPIEVRAWVLEKPESVKTGTLEWTTAEIGASKPDKDGVRTFTWWATLNLRI